MSFQTPRVTHHTTKGELGKSHILVMGVETDQRGSGPGRWIWRNLLFRDHKTGLHTHPHLLVPDPLLNRRQEEFIWKLYWDNCKRNVSIFHGVKDGERIWDFMDNRKKKTEELKYRVVLETGRGSSNPKWKEERRGTER